MGSTRIGTGTKLDNLIQIGHNVVIGKNTVAAAQLGVAGSTHIGDSCMFGGQVGIAGHLHIADKVQIASQSGIAKDVTEPGGYMGSPIMSGIKFHRANAVFHKFARIECPGTAVGEKNRTVAGPTGCRRVVFAPAMAGVP